MNTDTITFTCDNCYTTATYYTAQIHPDDDFRCMACDNGMLHLPAKETYAMNTTATRTVTVRTRTQELHAALDALSHALGIMGNDEESKDAVKSFFNYQHRTLQQSIMRTVVLGIVEQLDEYHREGWTDHRNEAAAEMAHIMLDAVADDTYLPKV